MAKKLLIEKYSKELASKNFPSLDAGAKGGMARLLENQSVENIKLLSEGTVSGDIGQYTPILMPMVRQAYPSLVANHLVGIQPMKAPTGFMYALTYHYTGTGNNPISPVANGQIVVVTDATGAAEGDLVSASADASPADPVEDAVGKVVYVDLASNTLLVEITSGSFAQGQDIAIGSATVAQNTDNPITGVFSNRALFQKVLPGYTGTYSTSIGEQLGNDMKEVGFGIGRTNVTAETRKFKGKYTIEMLQDMKSQHGADAEAEIMNLMNMELQFETDREVVEFVNTLATPTTDVADVSAYNGRWEIENNRSLAIKISNEGRIVGKETRRGQANTMLVSPKVAVALETLGSFETAPVDTTINATNSGLNPNVGTFDKKYTVVVDNFTDGVDYVTVGYKGAVKQDAGAFLAPYVGASFTKTVTPDGGQPALILSSRYGLAANPLDSEKYFRNFAVTSFGATSPLGALA